MAGTNSRVAKFLTMANALEKQVEHARRPMTQRPTPKRNREYASRLIEGAHWDRARLAALSLADAHVRGTVPSELANVLTKAQILAMVKTHTGSNGYYDVHDTGKFIVDSAEARSLRVLAELEVGAVEESIDLLKRRVAMENIVGFWPTPDDICEQIVDLAEIDPGHSVLEPSCGWGSILDAVKRRCPEIKYAHGLERNSSLAKIAAAAHSVENVDFMEYACTIPYDRILMNPPFENGQDVQHVRHAFDRCLAPGGRLVAIMSNGVNFRSDRRTIEFREWSEANDGEISPLPSGAFDRPGLLKRTAVSACILVISKPAAPVLAAFDLPDLELHNDPPRRTAMWFGRQERTIQRLLIDELNCLPG